VLAAERRRRDTGRGSHVRIALQDMGLATIGSLGYLAEVQINDEDRQGYGNHIFGTFGHDFGTRDDRRVMIMAISVRQWRGLQKALGFAAEVDAWQKANGVDLNDEGERFRHREQLADWIAPRVREHTLADIGPLFDANGVCWGVYRSPRQAMVEDPNCSTANPLFQEIEQPGIGRYLAAGSPMRFGDLPPQPVKPAPTLGEHGPAIASADLGRSPDEVAALRAAGVLSAP
jgi:2-methylfumaryl-CoA isomerase